MNQITIHAEFFCDEEKVAHGLVSAVGESGNVEWQFDRGIAHVRYETTSESDLMPDVLAAVERVREFGTAIGAWASEGTGVFRFSVDVEELVAIGGNWHTRGDIALSRVAASLPSDERP